MKAPIILYTEGCPYFFLEPSQAELYMEPDDLISGCYSIFDSSGILLEWVIEKSWSGADEIKLLDPESPEVQRDRLRSILLQFLADVDESLRAELDQSTLEEIIERCKRYASR